MAEIRADREVCVGAGMCALTAPELFDQDDEDGRVVVLVTRPEAELRERAREAVRLCPSGALSLSEEA
ncbi:ferredoxin [Streptoalloteichus tenebrarius]|uniref:Ferredoxin n=1 Tax=Streptoalloteichus tenebrarius (strain ATCC 17920 / DSM 40477 / JCM 4838 / CBS 697.72 / NBRC 16177 / NCIMB 11028 / NRRL B-12390 / A12253. 1 / ISP 5477) TaxID=1933 RepID=A0ABT1HLT7_STRSD|nr:(4Fe-4S)-binding protein [Streptoalloteichus tenebrarius]MCP2256474.1 ferredoxin [Streptoalloteichus tenebrarius]BFF04826.1 ferredoxin [Streptoalloteichus tenebrarius]